MKTKEEAVRFIHQQMDGKTPVEDKKYKLSGHLRYGWMEVKELLEYLYGNEFHNNSK